MFKRGLCCLLLPTLLLTSPSNIVPLKTKPLMDRELNKNSYYIESEMDKHLEEYLEEQEKIRIEEIRLKELEIEKQRQAEESKTYIDFELTFYTFKECVGGINAVTTHGDRPYQGIVASNVYPQGTIIHLENWGEVLVWDRGGENFNNGNRLDVFLEPMQGESLEDCSKRAFELGHIFTEGYIKE